MKWDSVAMYVLCAFLRQGSHQYIGHWSMPPQQHFIREPSTVSLCHWLITLADSLVPLSGPTKCLILIKPV